MVPANDDLKAYRSKRDLDATPEPDAAKKTSGDDGQRFVIQKHDASSLHYDLRLETGGVLKSWAVPRGPSTDPSEKRLAMPTEDHPVSYIEFEGVIPEDQYGAGPVLVWDTGEYENETTDDDGEPLDLADSLEAGHISFHLHGEKVSGGYALTRTGQGDDQRWLLVKKDDEDADARRNPTSTEPESVLTGRTLEEVRDRG